MTCCKTSASLPAVRLPAAPIPHPSRPRSGRTAAAYGRSDECRVTRDEFAVRPPSAPSCRSAGGPPACLLWPPDVGRALRASRSPCPFGSHGVLAPPRGPGQNFRATSGGAASSRARSRPRPVRAAGALHLVTRHSFLVTGTPVRARRAHLILSLFTFHLSLARAPLISRMNPCIQAMARSASGSTGSPAPAAA